jgi:hypothetical protein
MRVVGSRAASVSFAAMVIFLTSCDRDDGKIKVYRVSKAPLESSAAEQGTMPTNAASPAFPMGVTPIGATTVTTPPNWEPQPLSQMRQASFLVHGENGAIADISFVSLGPAAGNVLDNVNRWLEQLGQPPITSDKLASTIQNCPLLAGRLRLSILPGSRRTAIPTKMAGLSGPSHQTKTALYFLRCAEMLRLSALKRKPS